jgi:DNA-binding MarR family transcriptional regulator
MKRIEKGGCLAEMGHMPYILREGGTAMAGGRKPTRGESVCIATAMRKASRRLTQLYDDALEQCGLRSTQLAILTELNRRSKEPPTMAELADALVMDRSALGHNLGPLEREGFIARIEGEEDRRRRHVTLTSQGEAKFREAMKLWQIAQDRFLEVFGTAQAEELRTTLLGIAYDDRLATLKE